MPLFVNSQWRSLTHLQLLPYYANKSLTTNEFNDLSQISCFGLLLSTVQYLHTFKKGKGCLMSVNIV